LIILNIIEYFHFHFFYDATLVKERLAFLGESAVNHVFNESPTWRFVPTRKWNWQ